MSSNSWNDFQHEHGGEGLSQADMSEMYHAEQDEGSSGFEVNSATDMNDTSETPADDDNGLAQTSVADFDVNNRSNNDIEETAENEPDNENDESSKSGNQWNDFQHEHAGEGLSHADMSEMYHAEQNACSSENENPASSDTTETVVDRNNNEVVSPNNKIQAATETSSNTTETPKINNEETSDNEAASQKINESTEDNRWNDFQHAHKGEGKTSSQLSEMYHKQNPSSSSLAGGPESSEQNVRTSHQIDGTNDANDKVPDHSQNDLNEQIMHNSSTSVHEELSSALPQNQWNKFEHENRNKGLIPEQMSNLYQQQQQQQQREQPAQQPQTTNSSEGNSVQSTSNAWNTFEHENKNKGLTPEQMSNLYQQQQQQTTNSLEGNSVQSTSNAWNTFEHENKNKGLTPEQMSNLYQQQQQQQTTNSLEGNSVQSTSNAWNTFEHENKNKGLTPEQMSNLYQQQQQQQTTNSSEGNSVQSTSNAWNTFEHQNRNKGLTHEQMSNLYQQQQQQTTNSLEGNSVQSTSNAWNTFEHENKNKGLTPEQMSNLYQQQQQQQTTNSSEGNSVQSTSNAWNTFEHQNRNKGLTHEQMSNLYQQQQHEHQTQRPKATIQWNLFQHLYGGKNLSKQEMSHKYNMFKENERTFYWGKDFELVLAPGGKLKEPNSVVGQEAMKTGLFDEQNRLRRKGDIPYSVFQAKMRAMGVNDPSRISSMYWNTTGSQALHTQNLRQYAYRKHAATGTTRRDPDHILELQVVAAELRKEQLDDETFHTIRCVLNGEFNIESRGVQINRIIKAAANRDIARNNIKLTKFTFEQEKRQAQQANNLADVCQKNGCQNAETILRCVADKCSSLYSIHNQLMQLNENITDSQEKCERERCLIESIHQYEEKYGSLNFHGSQFTEYRKRILDEAHYSQR